VIANSFDQFGHWAGNSDALNFGDNLVHGHGFDEGLSHPTIEGDFAPKLDFMDKFKEMTTVRFD
jgi:hypothetical protein